MTTRVQNVEASRAPWSGAVVNLDSQPERLALTLAQLERCGISSRYRRLAATAARPPLNCHLSAAEFGCFDSHARALASAPPGAWFHVMEDDVALSAYFHQAVSTTLSAGALEAADLIFTGVTLVPNDLTTREMLSTYTKLTANTPPSFALHDLNGFMFSGTGSYLVNPRSAQKIQAMLASAMRGQMRQPIDLFYRSAIWDGRIKAAVFFPFLSAPRLDAAPTSSIQPRDKYTVDAILNAMSAAFVVDASIADLWQALPPPRPDERLDFFAAAIRAILDDGSPEPGAPPAG